MNRRMMHLGILLCGLVEAAAGADGLVGTPIELRTGDRVVLVGSTLIEREAESGYLETRLARRYPGQAIVVRNLGWTGDTVAGITRGKPNPPTDGFAKLVEHVVALKPTVIVLGYGANESFGGAAGLPAFGAGLSRLWDALSPTGAKFVVLTPTRQANLGPPLPDPTAHNADLQRYGDVLVAEAARRGATSVDLGRSLPERIPNNPLPMTSNSLHLTPTGYYEATDQISRALAHGSPDPQAVRIAHGQATATTGATVAGLVATPTMAQFQVRYETLPSPLCPAGPRGGTMAGSVRAIQIDGLEPGRYVLRIDGVVQVLASAAQWKNGIDLVTDPEAAQVEALRQAVIRKNLLYFHRWRPQNETYLFGFRKHEQGRNAAELVAFDPLIAAAEGEIVRLSQPVPHTYELTPHRAGDPAPLQPEEATP